MIAQNELNPVIPKLLENSPSIIYNKNPLKIDISLLLNAYNIAGGGKSTFFYHLLLLNINKKVVFLFQLQEKPFKLSIKINFEIFYNETKCKNILMYASKDYLNKIYQFQNTKIQRDLMLNYNCSNYFIVNDFYYLFI